MTVYSVYEPPAEAPDLMQRADRLAFVKEGFSWPALLVPLLWLIYYRMWIELIVLGLIYLALQVVFGTDTQGQALAVWASFAIGVLFAFEANDLRAAALERRGYRLAGVASGRDRTEAERSFFTAWLPQQASAARDARARRRASPRDGSAAAGSARRGRGGHRALPAGLDPICTSPSSITVRGTSIPPPRPSSARRGRAARRSRSK